MAEIRLIRIDFRLIHGQVVTKWVKQANADRIIIVMMHWHRMNF